jgi:hypothetical protein
MKNFDVLLSSKVQLCVLWCNAVHWKGLKLPVFRINARFISTVLCVLEFYHFGGGIGRCVVRMHSEKR